MTNAEIIFQNRVFLMEQGVIRGIPGTTIKVKDEQGEREVLMPEEIHTFQAWKKLGYQVQKGEHAIAKFQVWKFKASKAGADDREVGENEDLEKQKGKCFMKLAFFFTADQVKEVTK